MEQANILFIQVDQQAASALPAYGNLTAKTPNISRIAEQGVVFDNAYTNFPVCAPSRCSMMSGLLASKVEAYDNATEFKASIPTMAHYLRYLDYQTTLCGKMHFIGPDQLHGFEERLTPELYSADFMTMPQWEGEDDDFASDAYEALVNAGPVPRTVQMDYDEEVAYKAEQKIYDLARSDDERPFFLLLSFTHPHEPYLCKAEYWNQYSDDEIELPIVGRFNENDLDPHSKRIYRHYNLSQPDIGDHHIRNARRAYYGSMSYVDGMIGRLLYALEELKLEKNTFIFFTSDHGDMLGERGMWFKKTFFQNSVKVPMIVAGPGIEPRRLSQNISLIDLLPTFLDIADVDGSLEPVESLTGHSFMPLLYGDTHNWPDVVFSELTCEGVVEPVMMVKDGPYKYIYAKKVKPLLYNLDEDPNELNNLAGKPEVQVIEKKLQTMGGAIWGDLGVLREEIVKSQKSRLFLRQALEKGKYSSWDEPILQINTGDRYLRRGKTYNAWNYCGVDKLRKMQYR